MKHNKFTPIFIFLFFILKVCLFHGQTLLPSDPRLEPFNHFGQLYDLQLSEDDKWASWRVQFEVTDTLMVRNTETEIKYSLPEGMNGSFAYENSFFIYKTNGNAVGILNLESGKIEKIERATSYTIGENSPFIVFNITDNKNKRVQIRNLKTGKEHILFNVSEYSFDPKTSNIVYAQRSEQDFVLRSLNLVDFKPTDIIESKLGPFLNMVWNLSGSKLSFMEEREDKKNSTSYFRIYIYSTDSSRPSMIYLDPTEGHLLSRNLNISKFKQFFAKDGERLFFYIQPPEKIVKDDKSVEEWEKDGVLFSQQRRYDLYNAPYLYVWNPIDTTIVQIETAQYPSGILTGDEKNVLLYNRMQHEPQQKQESDIDVYIKSLKNETLAPVVMELEKNYTSLTVDNEGKYICYFKGGNWWSYNIDSGKHTNITINVPSTFIDTKDKYRASQIALGFGSWVPEEKSVMVYDVNDIWLIGLDGLKWKRITDGKSKNRIYRLLPHFEFKRASNFGEFMYPNYNLSKNFYLIANGPNGEMGYFELFAEGGLKNVDFGQKRNTEITMCGNKSSILYISETNSSPQQIIFKKENGVRKSLFDQNYHHAGSFSSGTELIHYLDEDGNPLKGILLLPKNYDSNKLYPMVVSIYEDQSNDFYKYWEPSLFSDGGFSNKLYTKDGYFVLLPDIDYKMGNPGFSSLHCVEAAVSETSKSYSIDKARIGLIGHSFGGYETAFIIGHSETFAAAVAGAGIMDLTGWYFSLEPTFTAKTMMWRMEFDQMRLGQDYFSIKSNYLDNSPIQSADKINTPLLLWWGKDDTNVIFTQSVSLYLALRRMHKNVRMLLYPDEDHSLWKVENQLNLDSQIKNWFDTYLKP